MGQEAHLMANSVDKSVLAAIRKSSAEVEEPQAWLSSDDRSLPASTGLSWPVHVASAIAVIVW